MRINRIILAAELARLDITNTQLAERARICKGTLSAARSGKKCRIETAARIAEALGVTLEKLTEEAR